MKYLKYFKESIGFDIDWVKDFISFKKMHSTDNGWSQKFNNLNTKFKTFKYLPNGLWEVTKDIDIQMTSLRHVEFKQGYFLCTYNGKIYYSWDNGVTWKPSYDLNFNEEIKHTAIGTIENIYMTFYRSLKKCMSYSVIGNARKNSTEVYSALEKIYDKTQLGDSADMGDMGFND